MVSGLIFSWRYWPCFRLSSTEGAWIWPWTRPSRRAAGGSAAAAPRKEHRTERFPDMVMIRDRPADVIGRLVPGHWKGDLIVGKSGRSAIATLVERTTRFIILVHLAGNRGAENLRDRLADSMRPLPPHLRRSLTWDQGTEMACPQDFTRQTRIPVCFSHNQRTTACLTRNVGSTLTYQASIG
jgi:IS30 family transposase